MTTATVRELRSRFPDVRKLVERDGEVIVTDQGTPRSFVTFDRRQRRRSSCRSHTADASAVKGILDITHE
jgi:antitoxin (DNA-binding transcriptional repressor) of toxin-antitoxin stability system